MAKMQYPEILYRSVNLTPLKWNQISMTRRVGTAHHQ